MLRRFVLALVPATILSTGAAASTASAAEDAASSHSATPSEALQWQPRWRFQRPQFRRPQFQRPQFQRPAGGVPFNPYVFMPRPRPFIAPKFDASRFAAPRRSYIRPPSMPRTEYDQYGREWENRNGQRNLRDWTQNSSSKYPGIPSYSPFKPLFPTKPGSR